jgi:hypothetical protein
MKRVMFISLLSLAAAAFPQSITLVSPNGGETLTSGQPAMVRWKSEKPGVYVWLEYSVDNGKRWRTISTSVWATADSCVWTPMVKNRVDKIIFRITADTNVYALSLRDTSDSSFVILPSSGDDYEPNDDFSSAFPISLGDSAVKNAFVFGADSLESDSAFFDVDYYKVTLEAGKLLTISLIPWNRSYFDDTQQFAFALFDSSKSLLYSNNPINKSGGYYVTRTGNYYIKIRNIYYSGYGPPNKYGLSVHQLDYNNPITIVTPNGGETFSPKQAVMVQWQQDSICFYDISIQYSIDSGKSWRNAWYGYTSSPTSRMWRVPHLKHGTDRALIRAFPTNISNPPFGVSNGTFTILASPNDAYEPNDDFASAKAVELGDSVVKNAIVMNSSVGEDSSVIDTSLTDNDFFKVSLTAGSVVVISGVNCQLENDTLFETDLWMGYVFIRLYDASKNEIATGSPLSCYILQSGVYYCEISLMEGNDCWNKYCLSIRQAGGAITVISPNGGENFTAGQKVTVRWTADSSLEGIGIDYSKDNGISWKSPEGYSIDNNSFSWTVPVLKTRTDHALVQVALKGVQVNEPSDVSNGTFTIQAAPEDAYEPNNDILSAYPIAVGDSVVKNASTYILDDVFINGIFPPDSLIDLDYFKVNLTAGSLVWIRCGDSVGGTRVPRNEVFNGSQQLIAIPGSLRYISMCDYSCYTIKQPGVYYIKVWPEGHWQPVAWYKYGLSIKSFKTLLTQTSVLDPNAMEWDTSLALYRSRLTADTTKLTIDFTLSKKYERSITTMVLAPEDFAPLPDEKAKAKVIAVIFDLPTQGDVVADIAIPYDPSDLNGYPEKTLVLACQDYQTGDRWKSVPSSVDTAKHQIVVHLGPFFDFGIGLAIFQVYIKSNTGIGPISATNPPVFGIRSNILIRKPGIAVHFSLPTAANADLRLYDVQGKCVRRGTFPVRPGSSTLLWNLGALSNGKYILTVKAGAYHSQETLLIVQ